MAETANVIPEPMTRPSLPRFVGRTDHDQAVLDASQAVVALFVQARSSAFSVKALADHTGYGAGVARGMPG